MEYRYDGARQRYMVREREPITMVPYASDGGTWHDYSAASIYADYSVDYDSPSESVLATETVAHESGLGQFDRLAGGGAGEMNYLHGNLVGTTEGMSGDAGTMEYNAVYSAFGEPVFMDGSVGTRYGYAGAWGYQTPGASDPLAELGWLHVGHRYYAPELGRFVQRDPIGIWGGSNVYAYVGSSPTTRTDPLGLCAAQSGDWSWKEFGGWIAAGTGAGAARGALTGGGTLPGAGIGAAAGAGGYLGKWTFFCVADIIELELEAARQRRDYRSKQAQLAGPREPDPLDVMWWIIRAGMQPIGPGPPWPPRPEDDFMLLF